MTKPARPEAPLPDIDAQSRDTGARARFARAGIALSVLSLASGCTSSHSPYELDYPTAVHLSLPSDRYRLENGLEVILAEDHSVPVVAVDLWYHAGSKDDPPGRAGLAHLTEHLVFDGARDLPPFAARLTIERAGGHDIGADTSRDHTAFWEMMPRGSEAVALWLESDRLASAGAPVDGERLEAARRVVVSEQHDWLDDQPYGRVSEIVWGALFPSPHPYHHPAAGFSSEIAAILPADVEAFTQCWYVPRNATLAVVGDFDPATMRQQVAHDFASIPPGPALPDRPDVAPVDWKGERRLTIEADVPLPRVVVAWPVFPRFADGSAELEVGAEALGGYLKEQLAEGAGPAIDVSARTELYHLAGAFEVTLYLPSGGSPNAALAALDSELHHRRSSKALFDRTDFAASRGRVTSETLYEAEPFLSRARLFQTYSEGAGTPDFANAELDARRAVYVEDARKAYYDFLRWDRRVVAVVVPTKGAPMGGRLVGGS